MGMFQPKPYRKLNKETGRFEWVYPDPIEYVSGIGKRGGKFKMVESSKNTKQI